MDTNNSTPATRWGRVRWGARRTPAMAIAIPAAVPLAAVGAWVAVAAGQAGPNPTLGGIVFFAALLVPFAGLVWALIVDRETLRGAPRNPEESVEVRWYERAAAGALTDVILIAGIGVLVTSFWPVVVPTQLILAGVIVVAMADVGIRILVLRRRG